MTDEEKDKIIDKLDNLSDRVHNDLVEFSIVGNGNIKGLVSLMERVDWLWHDTMKGVCTEMPEMRSTANLFARTDEKLRKSEPNVKLRALARIKNWLTFIECCFAILEGKDSND